MDLRMSRRSLVSALALSPVVFPVMTTTGRAQETSPFAGLGLPELELTVTATSIEGMPASIAAGRYLVTVTASGGSGESGGGVQFVRPASDNPQSFAAILAPPSGSPVASPSAVVPEPTMTDDEFSALMYDSAFTGSAFAEAGETTQVLLELEPGQWLVAGGFEEPQPPVYFDVTGSMPSSLAEPDAGATITMADYSFTIGSGELKSGSQVVKVENAGAQPHHIYLGRSPEPVSESDLEMIAMSPDDYLVHVLSVQTISTGNAVWLPLTLSPGPHVMLCYFPSLEDGAPHFLHGMYLVTEVDDPA